MENKISLQDLAQGLARHKRMTKREAEAFVRRFFDLIGEYVVADGVVKIKGFGVFKITTVDSRESVNVNTGERFVIDPHARVSFTPSASLRDAVNKPFADFETVVLSDKTKTEDMDYPQEPDDEPDEAEPERYEEMTSGKKRKKAVTLRYEPEEEDELDEEEDMEEEEEAEEPVKEKPSTKKSAAGTNAIDEQSVQKAVSDALDKELAKRRSVIISWGGLAAIALLALLLVMCGFFVGYKYGGKVWTSDDVPQQEQWEGEEIELDRPYVPVQQAVAEMDTLATEPQEEEQQSVQQEVARLAELCPQVEGGEYLIIGTREERKIGVGDNLVTLAIAVYGDKDFAKYIAVYNNIANPNVLPLGKTIKLPELCKKE